MIKSSKTNKKYEYAASAAPFIRILGWQTISDLIQNETATLMYKSLKGLAPDYMRNIFIRCSENNKHVLHSADIDLKVPPLKTYAGQRDHCWTTLWNSLNKEPKKPPF